MATKARDIRMLLFILTLICCLSKTLHSAENEVRSDSTSIFHIALLNSEARISKQLNTPDGNSWQGIFEEGKSYPKMIFGCDCPGSYDSPEQIAANFLLENSELFGFEDFNSDLNKLRIAKSPGSTHVFYQQTVAGLPVLNSTIGVHIDSVGRIELATNAFKPSEDKLIKNDKSMMGPEEALAIVKRHLEQRYGSVLVRDRAIDQKPAVLKIGNDFLRVWRIIYPTLVPLADWVFDIDAQSGTIYRKVNAIKYMNAWAYIYQPNPLAQRSMVELKNLYNPEPAQPYTLKGLYFEIIDSLNHPVSSPEPIFDYPYNYDERTYDESPYSDPRYEEVMVYYNLESLRSYYRKLDFHFFTTYKLKADAHGIYNVDDSCYSPAEKTIFFGDGDVNDASDADVILHEQGHALIDFVIPEISPQKGEVEAMHEGYADYFSASYTNDPCVGEWDAYARGNSCIRNLQNEMHYDKYNHHDHLSNTPIWSSALWKIRQAIVDSSGSREDADRIVTKSLFHLPTENVTFKEGAIALLLSDLNLYHGRYSDMIENVLKEWEILTEDDISGLSGRR